MTSERKVKILFDEEVECAHCKKPNHIIIERETIEEPVKGEYEIRARIEKGLQQKLVTA